MKPWSTNEDNTLKYCWALGMTGNEIAEQIPGRTPMASLARAHYIGLARRASVDDRWTAARDTTLREKWMRGDSVSDIAQSMRRSYQGIITRARRINLPRRRDDKEWAIKARAQSGGCGRGELNPDTFNYEKIDRKFQMLWARKHGWRDYDDYPVKGGATK